MQELDGRGGGGELPVHADESRIAILTPSLGLRGHGPAPQHATIQALPDHGAESRLRDD